MSTALTEEIGTGINLAMLSVGSELPQRRHTATNVSLFMYNAAVWNAHRIHYQLVQLWIQLLYGWQEQ